MGIAVRKEIEGLTMRLRHPRQQGGTAWATVCLSLLCVLGTGCGMVGDPIPPEDIGIEAKVRAQQAEQRRAAQEEKRIAPIEESDMALPPLQPIGTQ